MPAYVLTPNVIEALFQNTRFGGAEKSDIGRRGLMVECVLKRAAGYGEGHTINNICREAGLLSIGNVPNAIGFRWAFDQIYKSGAPTILERLEEASLCREPEPGEDPEEDRHVAEAIRAFRKFLAVFREERERDSEPRQTMPVEHNEQQALFTAIILRNWDRERIESFAWHLLGPEAQPAQGTVSVPADLAEDIAYLLADRAAAMLERRVEDEKPSLSDHAMIGRLYGTRARLRACPGYGSDGARTVKGGEVGS
jgi:hypothetical protein